MKKVFAALLAVILIFSFASCLDNRENQTEEEKAGDSVKAETKETEETEDTVAATEAATEPEDTKAIEFTEKMTELLGEIFENYSSGTAGSTLISFSYALRCADLFAEYNPTVPELSAVLDSYRNEMTEEENAELSDRFINFIDVASGVYSICSESAEVMIGSCGYTPEHYPYDNDYIGSLFTVITDEFKYIAYENIVSDYISALSDKLDANGFKDKGLCYMLADESLETVSVVTTDIDGDGNKELIFGAIEENADNFRYCLVYDMWAFNSYGYAEKIVESGERDRYYYAGENVFANIGSNSAEETIISTAVYSDGKLNSEEKETKERENIFAAAISQQNN